MNKNTRTILIPLCVSLIFGGCQKPPAPAPLAEEELSPSPTPTLPPIVKAATPEPSTPAPPSAPVLAPPGVFFLKSRLSVSTDDGLVGLPPGTRVVQQADGRYLAEGHIVEIAANQLTNDLGVAARVAAGEKAARAQTAPANAAQTAQAAPNKSTPPPRPAAGQPNRPPTAGYNAATPRPPAFESQSSLNSGIGLGGSHSKTADGISWQKSPDGKWWVPVRRLNGKPLGDVGKRSVQ